MEGIKWRWVAVTAIAPVAWGSNYVVTRQLLPADVPLWGATIRALPAGLLLLAVVRCLPRGSWWWRALLLGVLNVGGFFVLVYVAGQRLPSSLAASLMSTSAAGLALLAWWVLGQRPRPTLLLGAAVGIVGVLVMLGVSAEHVDPWGVAASVGAMLSSSLGFVLTVRWGGGVGPVRMAAWQLVLGGVVLLPVSLIAEGTPPALDAGAVAGFGYVVIVATVLAYVAWFAGLPRVSPGVAGVVGLLNPGTGVLLGVVLAGEMLSLTQVGGLALVVAGVALGLRSPRADGVRVLRFQPRFVPGLRRRGATAR